MLQGLGSSTEDGCAFGLNPKVGGATDRLCAGKEGTWASRAGAGQGRRCELASRKGLWLRGRGKLCLSESLPVGSGWAESGMMPAPPKEDRPVYCSLSWSAARVPRSCAGLAKGFM